MSDPLAPGSGTGPEARAHDFDWIVVGSGFGGSVAALRLAEKGYRVAVLEQGRRYADADFASTAWEVSKLVWAPRLGLRGIMKVTPLQDVTVLSGVGVGGGSLVYAGTLYVPHSDEFYRHPQWAALADWRAELAPHYATAERMLGISDYTGEGPSERLMRSVAARLGVADSARNTRVGIFFGESRHCAASAKPGSVVPDPYFDGAGPSRTACVRCGQCMLGCRFGAKNTLVKNYLWLAERQGAMILSDRTVTDVRPLTRPDGSDGYVVTSERTGAWPGRERRVLRARGVVVAGGALGTNALLRSCKDRDSLPRLSARLGELVRTNSETITAVSAPSAALAAEIAITASIYPDASTHITNNTYGAGGDAMALAFGPMVSGDGRARRTRAYLGQIARRPGSWLSPARVRGWSRRSVVFTTMQSTDSSLRLVPGRRGRLQSVARGEGPASQLPIARRVTELAAAAAGGQAQGSAAESLLGTPMTAHFLGGAVIGADPARGVVDAGQRAFGYRNLLVCDGAAVPANVGVNPSLTITALAERSMAAIGPAPAR